MSYSEREEIKKAKKMFLELKHDGVKDRGEHAYICGWLDKSGYDYRQLMLGTKCAHCGSMMITRTECVINCLDGF